MHPSYTACTKESERERARGRWRERASRIDGVWLTAEERRLGQNRAGQAAKRGLLGLHCSDSTGITLQNRAHSGLRPTIFAVYAYSMHAFTYIVFALFSLYMLLLALYILATWFENIKN